MTSQQGHSNDLTKESPHSEGSPLTSESDVDGEDPIDGDEQALNGFLQAHPQSTTTSLPKTSNRHLPSPVVIPQRRPGNKSRGFVEAYAPSLEQFGIQQDEFINFIRAVNKAVRANKWLGAIQLAAVGTSFVPNSIALGVSVAVQVVAGVIAKAETRWKTNSFLDRINEEYFRPRGLYCLLMAYTPLTLGDKTQFDVSDAISNNRPPSSTSSSTKENNLPERARKNLRNPVARTIKGEESLPSNVAPLVYPNASVATQDSGKKNAMTRINNYFDDRAQARYSKESTHDILSAPSPPTFKNRYLDPNHPATTGGLLGLVSGGHLTPNPEKAAQRYQSALDFQTQAIHDQQAAMMENLRQQLKLMNLSPEQEEVYVKQYEEAFRMQEEQLGQQAEVFGKGTGRVRTIWNVSYLMIVEIPSDEEIAAARTSLEASEGRQFGAEVEMRTVEI